MIFYITNYIAIGVKKMLTLLSNIQNLQNTKVLAAKLNWYTIPYMYMRTA